MTTAFDNFNYMQQLEQEPLNACTNIVEDFIEGHHFPMQPWIYEEDVIVKVNVEQARWTRSVAYPQLPLNKEQRTEAFARF